LIIGLALGLVLGLVYAGESRGDDYPMRLLSPALWLFFGLVFGLILGWFLQVITGVGRAFSAGLSLAEVGTRSLPNEGVHRSAWNAARVGSFAGLLTGLFVWLVFGLVDLWKKVPLFSELLNGLNVGLFFGLVCGLFVGLSFGMRAGGESCIKHVVLRLWLIGNGRTPWNYVRFLDFASDRILLRKRGGGYAFIHRMLMDHFAARYLKLAYEPPRR
jgi:hypothetical protein